MNIHNEHGYGYYSTCQADMLALGDWGFTFFAIPVLELANSFGKTTHLVLWKTHKTQMQLM